jgi:hypothetical protein
MEQVKNEIIQKGIEAKKQKFEIREDLIREGYDTLNFDKLYATILTQLGLHEPSPQKVTVGIKTYIPPEFGGTGAKLPHINNGISYTKVGVFLFIVMALIVTLLFVGLKFVTKSNPGANVPLQWGEDALQKREDSMRLNFNDEVLQGKVKATVASAMIQGGRMGSYDGVCRDISVIAPVACKELKNSFMIYAPMSNGTYFCEDKEQQGSIITQSPVYLMSCR